MFQTVAIGKMESSIHHIMIGWVHINQREIDRETETEIDGVVNVSEE